MKGSREGTVEQDDELGMTRLGKVDVRDVRACRAARSSAAGVMGKSEVIRFELNK